MLRKIGMRLLSLRQRLTLSPIVEIQITASQATEDAPYRLAINVNQCQPSSCAEQQR